MFFNTKIVLLVCYLAVASALPNYENLPSFGGLSTLQGEALERAANELRSSLSKLAAGEGPVYELDRVISGTYQVVSGSSTKLNVDLINSNKEKKNCDVSIWSQSWLENGIQVTIECSGEAKVVRHHSA